MAETLPNFFRISFPHEAVAHVEINRPEKLNAFNLKMWGQYGEVFRKLSTDSSVRVVVVSGAGDRAFTAGLDITDTPPVPNGDKDPARRAWELRRLIENWQENVGSVEKCEKPVICVLHGISFGLAIDISTCADIRICAADTKFAVKEVDIGIAADIGTLSRLPKIVSSLSWVKEVSFTARVFGAEEALKQGLVSAVYKDKATAIKEAFTLATLVAQKSPLAVQGTKSIINYSVDHTIQDGLDYTRVWNSAAIQAADPIVAVNATMSKGKPKFAKL